MNSYQSVEEVIKACQDLQESAIIEVDLAVLDDPKIVQLLKNLGYFVARVEQSPLNTKEELLRALDQACGFPKYFGFNWDALADSLANFHWHRSNGYILIIKDLGSLSQVDLTTFLEIVKEVSELWANHKIPFKVLVPEGSMRSKKTKRDPS